MATATNMDIGKPTDRILLVDSATMERELVQFKFENEGFLVDVSSSAADALDLNLIDYSLIIVDLMNERVDGIEFTRAVKQNPDTYQVPVIISTVKTGEDIIVNSLDAGADDFINKPFSWREMMARVRSVLRRRRITGSRRMSNEIVYKGLNVNIETGIVTIEGVKISLTRTELLILTLLIRKRDQYFDRNRIKDEAWEDDNVSDRAVDTNISRLRKKIEPYGRYIVNRQGYGYSFVSQ